MNFSPGDSVYVAQNARRSTTRAHAVVRCVDGTVFTACDKRLQATKLNHNRGRLTPCELCGKAIEKGGE